MSVTNSNSAGGGNQFYGLSTNNVNSQLYQDFGLQSIEIFNSTGEGVFSGMFTSGPYNGESGFITARQIIKTLDLVSEGEIEGIVSGEYVPNDSNAQEGQVGWAAIEEKPLAATNPEAFLRSVYLNDTPVVNEAELYNFQNCEIAITNGTPSGIIDNDNFLHVDDNQPIEKTRAINERLRGPDITDVTDNPFFYHSKVYRFLNRDLDKVRVSIKIPALTFAKTLASQKTEETSIVAQIKAAGLGIPAPLLDASLAQVKVEELFPDSELGQVVGSSITFKIRYRPVYQDALGNIDLGVSQGWYGLNGAEGVPITSQVKGLIRSPYLHEVVVDFPAELAADSNGKKVIGWELEITRVTLDSLEAHVSNESYIDSLTEIYESTLSYPNSCIASMNFNAEYFSQVPNRAYDMRLLKVKVPKGYDPKTRQYNHGAEQYWNGEFQSEKQWTDNPAWIFYDLLTNKRYGLGKHISETYQVDKWTLYEISKFCDTLVSNGEGGLEPRFTCNVLINTREEAFKVIKDFASVFRSMAYYGLGTVNTVMDKPRDNVGQFTNPNVKDGNFTYSSSSKKTIPTVCLIRYNDKTNFYKPALEYVENPEGIRKYGIREKEVTAFACTSRSQAVRLGRWILSTEISQTEQVSFETGPEALLLKPGDIISITDNNRSDNKFVGRLSKQSHTSGGPSSVTLDRNVFPTGVPSSTNYSFSLNTPTYFFDESVVQITGQQFHGDFRRNHVQTFDFNTTSTSNLTISTVAISGSSEPSGTKISWTGEMFPNADGYYQFIDNATWTVCELSDKNRNLYSITNVAEGGDILNYKIDGIAHDTGKYAYIESGIQYSYVETPQGTVASPTAPAAVTGTLTPHPQSSNGYTKTIEISVNPCSAGSESTSCFSSTETTIGYKIYVKEGSDFVQTTDCIGTTDIPKNSFHFQTVYTSDSDLKANYLPAANSTTYYIRVFSINTVSVLSNGFASTSTAVTNHYPIRDVNIYGLKLSSFYNVTDTGSAASRITHTSTSKDVTVRWSTSFLNQDTPDTQPVLNKIIGYKVKINKPNPDGAYAGNLIKEYFTDDQSFTFPFTENKDIGPLRSYDITVEATDTDGITSSGVDSLGSEYGWDIVTISNPKPTGYYLTPRRNNGTQVGQQQGCDNLWTEQFIDADGYVHLKLLSNSYNDLAGGYAYLSKHPFTTGDFDADTGAPKTVNQRTHLSFSAAEEFKKDEYEIKETNFELAGDAVFGGYDGEVVFAPSGMTGQYAPPYYMAVKFYDSFDRALRLAGDTSFKSGLILDSNQVLSDSGLYLGMSRDTTGVGGSIISGDYRYTTATSLQHKNLPDSGSPACDSHTYPAEIFPTKYYSANQGGFSRWIRININGQWEGQGISHVKVLTQKDVLDLYDYHGFVEYGCVFDEYRNHSLNIAYPNQKLDFTNNREPSSTRCNFKQAQVTIIPDSTTSNPDKRDHAVTVKNDFATLAADRLKYGGNMTSQSVGGWTATQKSNWLNSWYEYWGWYYHGPNQTSATAEYEADLSFFYANYSAPMTVHHKQYLTTGATRNWNDWTANSLPEELTRAGVAWGWTADGNASSPTAASDAKMQADRISSYNERGQVIGGKDRPLRGFRRFRVYFDEMNLPEQSDANGLASYSVVGINSWNGAYESWPVDPAGHGGVPANLNIADYSGSLLFAKDGASVYPESVRSWLQKGDVFENIPGVWNHHPAGFGQGYGGLVKTQKYFDIHMGRMVDDSYLNEAFFGVVSTNNYGISNQVVRLPQGYDWDTSTADPGLHEAVYDITKYVTRTDVDGSNPYG